MIHQIPVLTDNYIYVIHDPLTSKTAVVDPAVSEPVIDFLEQRSWTLDRIFNTHHHLDHVGGNHALKEFYNCEIVGSELDRQRIPGIDVTVQEGSIVTLGELSLEVLEVFGHTRFHIAYYCASLGALFCGDTLFSIGCGRLFEGTAEQMWASLQKIKSLPAPTKIYCAHEYTQANCTFALSIDPQNFDLIKHSQKVDNLRAQSKPTIPSSLNIELACNPFLRADHPAMRAKLNLKEASSHEEVFTELRRLKDVF
jgi:hydroxyacylglutathione hydrolase